MREDSGVAPGLASLPSGGGGITPLGDRFQPDLVKGTGSYAVPLNLPKGPNSLRPSLSLTYSTGAGNGPVGLGWRLTSMRIERRTDRGIPAYTDDDVFVIGDAEVLVPVGGGRYRPKSDTAFWSIERSSESWRIRTGDGKTLLLGQTAASRESDGGQVFAWFLDEERDCAGNAISYAYLRDGGRLLLDEVRWGGFGVKFRFEPRPDVLRNGVAGFERRIASRVASIELHCDRLAPTLMRNYGLQYTQAANGASLLRGLTLSATEGAETAAFPPLGFDYAAADFEAWRVHRTTSTIAPPALGDPSAQWVDLTGDALPDVLQSTSSRMLLWRNAGNGHLEGPTAVPGMPSTVALDRDNVAFADLDGNGRVDLFAVDQPLQLAFESNGRGGFEPEPVVFRNRPSLCLSSGDTRLMDIDNDGVTDLITTGQSYLLLHRHRPGVGFDEPLAVRRVADLAQFPDLSFGDRGVRLADMTGDGLQDFVLVQSGNVCYWPYFGNGRWGARVEMQSPPRFPPGYRDDRVFLCDLDGDGCADIVYAEHDRTLIWINQTGNGFAAPVEIPIGMGVAGTRILPCDFYGDGRTGFAWSAPAASSASAGYRVLRFDGGRKPYLMTMVRNGMGGESAMAYSNSTAMRLSDRSAGADWPGQLPFVVHLVRSITDRDTVSGRESTLSMAYHDGVYDGPQREFRGFTRVTVDNQGDDSVPTTRQVVTFFQGDPEAGDLMERDRQRALAGSMQSTAMFELAGGAMLLRSESTQTWDARVEFAAARGSVHFPFVTDIVTREPGAAGSPARIERTRLLDHDAHGNPGRRVRESFAEGEPSASWIRSEERYTHTDDEAAWLVKLPVRLELRDGQGVPVAVKISYYDGPAFTGLAEGAATHGQITRVQEMKLLESRLPAGYVGARDFAAMGLALQGAGDTRGYYATTTACARDARGNITEQRDAVGAPTKFVYDADGVYPIRATDARGAETSLVFSVRSGEPASVSLANGRRIRYEYDAIGRLAASFESDDAGVDQLVKAWVIDLASTPPSITSIAPVSGGRTRAEFAPGTDFANIAGASISRVYYDAFGKELLQVSSAPEQAATPRFVAGKRPLTNPRGLVRDQFAERFVASLDYSAAPTDAIASMRTRYDAQGNVTEMAGPGPEHFRVVRDSFAISHYEGAAAGALGVAEPPGPASRVERFDARGRLVRIEEDSGGAGLIATGYELTPDGRIEVIRDNAGAEVTRYMFAAAGEPIRIRQRDAGERTYYRDASGRLRERIGADGSSLFYRYDAVGRLTRMEHSGAGAAVLQTLREIFYDADPFQDSSGRFLDGRIAVVREAGNDIRFSYNGAGKMLREEVSAGGVTLVTAREYDLQGRMTATVYPDGHRVVYRLGANGAVTQIDGVAEAVRYAADGNLEGYRLINGVEVALPRDAVTRRLKQVSATLGGSLLRRLQYRYDSTGNIVGIDDELPGSSEHTRCTYDGLHRLASFEIRRDDPLGSVVKAGAYDYDAAGNLLRFEEGQPLALSYADAVRPARLTSVAAGAATRAVGYDARGHMQSFGDLATIEFDPLDRMSRVVKSNGTELRFAYDPQSRRILKEVTIGGVTSRVHYATGLYEHHDGHALRHIYLGTNLVASEKVTTGPQAAVAPAYYLADHHGTILLATDAAGTIIHNQRYTAFGSARNPAVELDRYLSRQRDVETGLLHLGARYYAPGIGRFISADWWVLENPGKPARMPQGFNVYSYALNNPLVFKDPSGLWFGIDDLIVAAVGFVVGFVSGLVYGLANGQGWGSLLTALETGLTTAAGAWLGWTVAGPVGAVMGGMNGLMSGIHGIYDWGSVDGWFAFLSDSTWGLVGTSLGNVVHVVNLFGNTGYRDDLSRRQNRHVYEGGFYLKEGFTFTQGNVISNAGQNGRGINVSFIANHEELHVWQSRFFGPLFQATYIAWGVGGFLVGTAVWLTDTSKSWGSLVETAAYYDNPFEYWAYKNDNNWPPSGSNPDLRWG